MNAPLAATRNHIYGTYLQSTGCIGNEVRLHDTGCQPYSSSLFTILKNIIVYHHFN